MPDRAAYDRDKRKAPLRVLKLQLAARAWALRIPFVARGSNLEKIISRTKPHPSKPYAGLTIETIARCCRKAVRRPVLMTDRQCLREGLLLQRFLTMAGFEPTLHFGVDRESLKKPIVAAHCWVIVSDQIINPPPLGMIEVMSISRGRATRAGAVAEASDEKNLEKT